MPKVLLVTSTRSGEGKSSSALALAQNFARREKAVLLIDSDLRKPAFKAASDKVGLSKMLTTDDQAGRPFGRDPAPESVAAAERSGSAQPRRPSVDRPDPQDHRRSDAKNSTWS